MSQTGRVVRLAILCLIGVETYLLMTFESTEIQAVRLPAITAVDLPPRDPRPTASIQDLMFYRVNPFRDLIELPPPPEPTPAPPPPPPDLHKVMSQFELVMPTPSSVMLEDKRANQYIQWRVGETRTVPWRDRSLRVTLRSVDANDFSVEFVAPEGQSHTFRLW